jgi:hypothetical protein
MESTLDLLFKEVSTSLGKAQENINRSLQSENPTEIDNLLEVALWELITSKDNIVKAVRHIDPDRFGIKTRSVTSIVTPDITTNLLNLCNICGSPACGSDHK